VIINVVGCNEHSDTPICLELLNSLDGRIELADILVTVVSRQCCAGAFQSSSTHKARKYRGREHRMLLSQVAGSPSKGGNNARALLADTH